MTRAPSTLLLACGLAAFLVAGCGGDNSANGTNGANAANSGVGLNTLVTVVAEPAGANCAYGGVSVNAGTDTNGNGVLDPSEITSTQDVCNGANGSNGSNGASGANGSNGYSALVAVVSEPAGTNCASGGNKVSTGLDTNANGVLDTSEITSSNYICNGANGSNGTNGANGSNGLNTLMAAVAEPAGSNCSNGGLKVTSGLDSNANNVLDAGEVTGTTYVCNGTNGGNGANGGNGLNSLLSIVTETAGANCTYGGQRISSGLDANNNGTLDPTEVASTKYICNGAGINWVDVTGTSVQAASNTGYLADNASQVAVTLPASPALGDVVRVSGVGGGGWRVAQNAGQSVITANLLGPSIASAWTPHDQNRIWYSVTSSTDGTTLAAVASGGQIYTSANSGVTWIARDSGRQWTSVASSADGTQLVAVALNDQIYTSTNSGVTWTPRESARRWSGVASSADGTKLVAVVGNGGQIYTSSNSGATWTPRDSGRDWFAVASSADGVKLVAVVTGGQIYTSPDSGVTWIARDSARNWWGIASSADGTKLVATENGGQIYTSADSGVTWTARDSARTWWGVASSADGTRLVAVETNGAYTSLDSGVNWVPRAGPSLFSIASSADGAKLVAGAYNAQIYTSVPAALQSTTVGTAGSISGGQYDAIELQYVGNNTFTILSSEGSLAAQ
jgi:hypothetical protein